MDVWGEPGVAAEAELIAAIFALRRPRSGSRAATSASHHQPRAARGDAARGRAARAARGVRGALRDVDKLDKIGADAVIEQLADPAGASALPRPRAREVVGWLAAARARRGGRRGPPPGSRRPLADLARLFELLDAYGVADRVEFDASIVRGLAYYTGVVFEAFDAGRKLRAVCGGGRYDRLLETLGGPSMPAVGFGFGDAVIAELLADEGVLPAPARARRRRLRARRGAAPRRDPPRAARCAPRGASVELVLGADEAQARARRRRPGRRAPRLAARARRAARGVVKVRDLASGEQSRASRSPSAEAVRRAILARGARTLSLQCAPVLASGVSPMHGWTIATAPSSTTSATWGAGFFTVNDRGHVEVRRAARADGGIDLLELVRDLQQRGLRTPLLIRFSDILAARVRGHLARVRARDRASTATGPLPRRLPDQGEPAAPRGRGARPVRRRRTASGSRPAASPSCWSRSRCSTRPSALIVCNGYKDRAYIETALLAQRLGRTPIIVIDRFHELDLVIKTLARARHPPAHRRARAAHHAGRGQVGRVDRRPLEVRPVGGRDRRGGRPAARRGHARLPRAAALPHRLADHRDPRAQGRAARGEPHLRRAARARRAGPSCSTSAAASASTTTARRRTSTRR